MLDFIRIDKKFDHSVFLIASFLFLVPFGRLSVIPMAVMALLGIRILFKKRFLLKTPEIIFFSLLFSAFWVPVLISLPDAVNSEKTAKVALVYSHYWLAGLFIVDSLRSDASRHIQLLRLGALIILFWVADAIFQALFGFDFFGFKPVSGTLNGVFGNEHPKLGIYLAALCPFIFVYAMREWSLFVRVSAFILTCSVIFASERRGGWIMLAVILICIVCWVMKQEKNPPQKSIFLMASLLLVVFSSTYFLFPRISERVDQTLLVFKGNLESVDRASSFRLPIYRVAVEMIGENPVNGVGARGFRYAYRDYAKDGDIYLKETDSLGALYAHQILLDIGSNTGFIGLAGYLAACWLLISRWCRGGLFEKQAALPYGLAILAIFFPLNTHYATYSSRWLSLIFYILAPYSSVKIDFIHEPIQWSVG